MIKGQWYLSIEDDFRPDYLISFKLIEKANMSLPSFELEFQCKDEKLVHRYCQKSYRFTVKLGKEDSPEEQYNLIVLSRAVINQGLLRRVKLVGVIDNVDYLYKQDFYSPGRAVNSTDIVSYYAGFSGLSPKILSQSDDKMLWINPGWTPRRFLQHVYEYSYFSSPSVFGINRHRGLMFGSVLDLPDEGKIISNKPEVADILVNNITYVNDEGFLSAWSGETLKSPYYFLEEDKLDVISQELSPLFCNSIGLLSSTKLKEYSLQNENVHKNWVKAYLINRQFHASLMSFRVKFFTKQFPIMKLLNIYNVQWFEQELEEINPYVSGRYIATEIVTILQHQNLQQVVTLSRESVNVI